MIKKFNQFLTEKRIVGEVISYQEIEEIMYYITDEFPELGYSIENTSQSAIIEVDLSSFIIELFDSSIDFPHDLPVLHYIEPKINELISDIDSQLKKYGLEVFYSDFGMNDAYYEIVVTEIGHKPEFHFHRYDEEGNEKERF